MDRTTLTTPVALFVFNRPETTQKVFSAIAAYKPARLFLIADGPRAEKAGEKEACEQVREVLSHVDWPCEVETNFAADNLGCQERIISGIDWVFTHVDEAIFLEDDCLPDPSFFRFCQVLLEKYRGDSRVAAISGTNLVEQYTPPEASYFFSQLGGNWGWATWKSEWQHYDRHLKDWPELKRQKMLSDIFDEPEAVAYWTTIFDDMFQNKGRNTWDYQWLYTQLKNNALTVVPYVNLVVNIGFGEGATHTSRQDSRFPISATPMEFPLKHPKSSVPARTIDRHLQKLFSVSFFQRFLRKLGRIKRHLVP
jgi:hypothetical protein